jgi:Cu2+-exporting ATPase
MDLVIKNDSESKNHEKFHSHSGHHQGMDPMEHHKMMADDFRRRFLITLPLTLLILVLSPQIQKWLGINIIFSGLNYLLLLLGTAIIYYGGKPFFQAAKEELLSKNWGMMTLVSLALSAGYLFSIASVIFFPGESLWWEISTLTSVFLLGHWLEMRAVVGTGGALRELAKLIPTQAHRIVKIKGKESIVEVETDSLQKGDIILVRPGEKIPADGMVTEGESFVNESMITGESVPVSKRQGYEVIGGAINNDGSLTIRVTKTGADSAISQIMELIRQAQDTKPSVQKLADKAANWLTVVAIVVSSLTFVYWFFINPSGVVFAATLAISVIVIACPHALGLAIPTVTTITTSLAAKNGILIRDMKGLEIARRLDYIVLDKTGTLTKGEFGISKIIKLSDLSENKILELAASIETRSEHSIAKGIVKAAENLKLSLSSIKNFKAVPGKGASATIGNSQVVVGNLEMMREVNVKVPGKVGEIGTIVYVVQDKKAVGIIVLDDEVRTESKSAIEALHKLGIKVAMLTGDKRAIAEKVGKELGIDTVFAEVLPEDKVKKVKELQNQGYVVGMVGDGVNDAPSLAQAHVGIAIGAGTSVAIESAEIVLVKSSPLDVVKVIVLSKKVDAKMKQNLAWATGYNVLAIPAAAGVFFPLGIVLRPEWGALLMSVSSVLVVANAMILKKAKLPIPGV